MTVRMIAEKLDGTFRNEKGLRQDCSLLSKSCDGKCCVDWKTAEESDEFLERVITGDEFSPLRFFFVPQMQIGAEWAAF